MMNLISFCFLAQLLCVQIQMGLIRFEDAMKGSDKIYHHGYQRYYEPILLNYQNTSVRMVEIGVENGISMQGWKNYFPHADAIYGIGYKNFQTTNKQSYGTRTTIYLGDQSDPKFLRYFLEDTKGKYDFIVDDGSHIPSHQKISFEVLWPEVKQGGYYFIEDIETSFWKKEANLYGYTFEGEHSFLDYLYSLVLNDVNEEYRSDHTLSHQFGIQSISFGQNIVTIKKRGPEDMPYSNRHYRFAQNVGK